MKRINNLPQLKSRRVELRQNQTSQEEILWKFLRAGRFGFKFKRQHSIGGYILDFYCPDKNLAVELDGAVHSSEEAREYDAVRDSYLSSLGIFVLRFSNSEIDSDIYKVLTKIKEKLQNI